MSIEILKEPDLDIKSRLLDVVKKEHSRIGPSPTENIRLALEKDLVKIIDLLSKTKKVIRDIELFNDSIYFSLYLENKSKRIGISLTYEDVKGQLDTYCSVSFTEGTELLFIGSGSLSDCWSDGLEFLNGELEYQRIC